METTTKDVEALGKLIYSAASCKATKKMFSLKTSYSTKYSAEKNKGCGKTVWQLVWTLT